MMLSNIKKDPDSLSLFSILVYTSIFFLLGLLYNDAFTTLVFAFGIILLLDPIVIFFHKKLNLIISIVLAFAIISIAITLLLYFLIPTVTKQFSNFYNFMINFFENKQWEKYFKRPRDIQTMESILNYITPKFFEFISNTITYITVKIPSLLSMAFYIILISIYGIYYFPSFRSKVIYLFPASTHEKMKPFLKSLYTQVRRYVGAQVVVAATVGILSGFGLYFAGVGYAFLLGVWAGMTNLVPVIGVILAAIPMLLVGLSIGVGGVMKVILLVIGINTFAFIWELKILGIAVKINAVAVLVAILIMGKIFGVIGVLISVPLVLFIRLLWRDFISTILERN